MSLKEATYQATVSYLSAFEDHELRDLDLYSIILQEVDQGLLEAVLQRCSHNQSWAADILGVSRNTLRTKIGQNRAFSKTKNLSHRRAFLKI